MVRRLSWAAWCVAVSVTGLGACAEAVGSPDPFDLSRGDAGGPQDHGYVPPGSAGGGHGDVDPIDEADAPLGEWTYVEVGGAVCRDGSPAGYYIKRSKASENLMIFLNGGGVCYDDFFCSINPPNPNSSLPGETLPAATLDILNGWLTDDPQTPYTDGIFADDARNPVGDWSMVFVPYCTGDVYGGTKLDAPVFTSLTIGPQQFVGYHNVGLFLQSFGPLFRQSAKKVLLAGSSAGGVGTLVNYDRTQSYFSSSRVFAITDSGIPFRTKLYDGSDGIETCLQKNWRELWGLDQAFPEDCEGCFDPSGGNIVDGLGEYIFNKKYPGRVLGGGISSARDEIMQLFFSGGLNNCQTLGSAVDAVVQFLGGSPYPIERFPKGLKDFIENVAGLDRVGSYVLEGTRHMHLFRPRFYEENGLGMSIAEWVQDILDEQPTHVGHEFLPQ